MSLFDTKFLERLATQTEPLLDLSGRYFSGSSLSKLIPVIAENEHITQLDLSDNIHLARGIPALAEFLAGSPRITHLRISNFSNVDYPKTFGITEAKELGNALGINTTLQSLDISGNDTYYSDETGINYVLKAIAENPQSAITEINISNSHGTLDGKIFSQFLEARKASLKSLSLEHNGGKVQHELSSFLRTNTTLEMLDLSSTCVDGINGILYSINKNPDLPLKELKLHNGYLKARDMAGLEALVRTSTTLESLDLSEAIRESGFPGLVKVLEAAVANPNSVLKRLDLSNNPISEQHAEEAFDHLTNLVKKNQLTHLNIANTKISVKSLVTILHSIATTPDSNLVDLNLSGNEMGHYIVYPDSEDTSEPIVEYSAVQELVSILGSTKTLKHLDLSNCRLSNLTDIVDAIVSNPDLHLDTLKLGRNWIHDLGSVGSILKGTKVVNLDLSDLDFTSALYETLFRDITLKSVTLNSCKLDDRAVEEICRVLKGNKNLKTLNLSRGNDGITEHGAKSIIKLLADADTSITSVDFPYGSTNGYGKSVSYSEYNTLARHISEWKKVVAGSDVKALTQEAADLIMMNVAWYGNGDVVRFMLTDLVEQGLPFSVASSIEGPEKVAPWRDEVRIVRKKDLFSTYKDDADMQKFLHGLVEKQHPETQKTLPQWVQDLHASYIADHPHEAIMHAVADAHASASGEFDGPLVEHAVAATGCAATLSPSDFDA